MLVTSAVILLFIGHDVFAQDADCDFRQNVQPGQRYIISPPYDGNGNYRPGSQCRWIGDCPAGYNCRVDCTLKMPLTTSCSADVLLISSSGDPQLIAANRYCGSRNLTVVSANQTISIALLVAKNSPGGSFTCYLIAQAAPKPPQGKCVCGVRKQARIVGGTSTGPNEYTSMAGLYNMNIERIHCGAVIISDRYVLTAAHCVFGENVAEYVVTLGSNNVDKGRKFAIESFTPHPQYNEDTYNYDIAVVKLRNRILFDDTISPICLPFKYQNRNLTGANIILLGWGILEPGGKLSDELQQVNVKAISNKQCSQTEQNINDRKICTLTPGKDACQNDSGGPGLLSDPGSGLLFNVCIVSNGKACASQYPGINTRVTEYLQWITTTAPAEYCVVR